MIKKLLLIICLLSAPVFAIEYNDLLTPKDPAYRLGITDEPENVYTDIEPIKKELVEKDRSIQHDSSKLTYADLSLKRMSSEVAEELDMEEKDMVGDLSLLWKGAATQSDTINFALYKLANPDADKPNEKSVKKVLSTIASMSTIVGAGTGNPLIAAGSLIGSNVMGIMSQDTKALNYKYTKVTDADMIVLVRKIADLQQKAVDLYYDYMTLRKKMFMIEKLANTRKKNFELAQNTTKEIILVSDTSYRSALDMYTRAKSEFYAKRAELEQFVGNETFVDFEKELAEREKAEQ